MRSRTYWPQIARWLSTDPLLFLDGPNLYIYVHNSPLIFADPSGQITIEPVKQLLSPNAKCGDAKTGEACIKWRWTLDPATKRKWPCRTRWGYFVQKVKFFCEIDRTCQNCPKDVPKKTVITYLEAIRIDQSFRSADDVASGFCFRNSCGIVKHEGEVKFFCEDQTGNLIQTWQGKQEFASGDCKITGGPWTFRIDEQNNEPGWFNQPQTNEKAAMRWFGIRWDCCGCGNMVWFRQTCKISESPRMGEVGRRRSAGGRLRAGPRAAEPVAAWRAGRDSGAGQPTP